VVPVRPRLITIPLSHYCERARWALDALELDYDEVQHLQRFASKVTKKAGARHTVPALVHDEGVLDDSGAIVRWASARVAGDPLYAGAPRAEIEALEDQLAGDYGVEVRRIVYSWFFRLLPTYMPYNDGAAPRYQGALLRVMRPLIVPKMKRYLGIEPERLADARDLVRATMDSIAERLADGRPYLFGDQLTAADLSFAALTYVSVLPPQHPMGALPLDGLDAEARDWVEQMRAHPAGVFALRLYEQRPPMRGRLPRALRIRPQGPT